MKNSVLSILLYFSIIILLMACGNEDEKTNSDAGSDDSAEIAADESEQADENEDDEQTEVESESEDDSALPADIPSDFPFPEGASLDVTESEVSGAKAYTVAFQFDVDPESFYEQLKEYATNNGYSIAIENDEKTRFSANSSTGGLVVDFTIMESVSIATITFTIL
ncbi:hypothetical protein GH741_01645 [Aquibacillus halophilus]|uniref:Uncharacterized protein n=1 Tax=Aquibacillus halophilus TaxID=930132 RepID=A0A6A8D6Y3_9BACI|nr:hypothetical protein [Aquibacillus halophilus]MRH41374.1 hypothetical protein [Aquibacillus halophilus]